jgi:four helix bundle protein
MEGWKSGRPEGCKNLLNLRVFQQGRSLMSLTSSYLQTQGLRDLRAYQLAKELAHLVYTVTSAFPRHEYELIRQMRGAAVSVFGNIAEGYGRNSLGDYIRFCEVGRGSLAEVGSYLDFCRERSLLKSEEATKLWDLYNHTWNTLGALIRSLREKKLDDSWDRSYGSLKEDQEDYNV